MYKTKYTKTLPVNNNYKKKKKKKKKKRWGKG